MSEQDFTVLIVDDTRLVRVELKRLLAKLGIVRIPEAANGLEAIKILEANPVDLIISDWYMPELSGRQLLLYVRRHDSIKNTPFIMITADSTKNRVLSAFKAGANGYIVKPFSLETISNQIFRFLPVELQKKGKYGRVEWKE